MKQPIRNSSEGKKAGYYSLGEASRLAGVSNQTLQYYIMCGLVEPATITMTNRKLFDQNSIDRIKLVNKLNKSGYPLREIREIFLKDKQ